MLIVSLALLGACRSPDPLVDPAADLVALLTADRTDVAVEQGEVVQMDHEECEGSAGELVCPGGVNLSSPYGMWTFASDLPASDGNPTFQLDTDEALVFVGRTPPEARYYSYTLYQYARVFEGMEYFGRGSIAPSLNHRVVQLDDQASDPFDAFVVIVVAMNQDVADRTVRLMRPTLEEHGVEEAVNILQIPWRTLEDARALREVRAPKDVVDFTPGHAADSDRFMVAWRVADPVDPEHPFFDAGQPSGHVLRLSFGEADYTPFAYPILPPPDDSPHSQGERLRKARDTVADAVGSTLTPEGFQVVPVATSNKERKSGFECNNGVSSCYLNSDDARYMRETTGFRLRTGASSFFLVGVVHDDAPLVHPEAADVSYSNVSIVDRRNGVATLVSRMDHELRGSARAWFPNGVADVPEELLDTLYVLQVSRYCEPNAPVCLEVPFDLAPIHAPLGWTERVYLNEATATAPPPSAVLPAVAVGIGPDIIELEDAIDLD